MNTKNNKRRRESRRKIEQVLIEFLRTKELNQISVSDICEEAELNRSTFYANYDDIYELADTIREKLESQVTELYKDEIMQGAEPDDYLALFRHIEQNQFFYKTYFKLGYDGKYKILQYDYELPGKYFEGRFMEYHAEFFKSGLIKIIKLWLQSGCRETPEEMFEVIKSEYHGRAEFFAAG